MENNLLVWQVAGLTFTAVLGTLLHFLFQWSNLTVFAPISSVNESTFEHMKLAFVPSLIFAFIQSCFSKDYKCFWLVKLIGIILGTLLIPVLFYTLSGAFGKLSAIIDISIFFVSIIIQYFIEYLLFDRLNCKHNLNWLYVILLLLIFALFITFTFYPPKIPLFLDPVTKTYGIAK